jgi:hypothetical protein
MMDPGSQLLVLTMPDVRPSSSCPEGDYPNTTGHENGREAVPDPLGSAWWIFPLFLGVAFLGVVIGQVL